MPFVVVLIGAILVIAAFNNAHGDFGTALQQDLPGFFKWGVALAAILGLGFVPGLKTPSRYLLALVLLVIFLHNYQAIISGLQNFAASGGSQTASGTPAATPTAADTANPSSTPTPTSSQVAGDTSSGSGSTSTGSGATTAYAALAANPFSPSAYLSAFESGFGGSLNG